MNTLAQLVNDRINPLMLRELRQMVRNRFVITLLNLFLGVLVAACFFFTMLEMQNINEGAGGTLFGILIAITGFVCFLAVLGLTGTTTASERMNEDLMYISTLSPAAIVFGKAWSGAVMTLMLMSAAAPFVMLAYLLRGLDIQTIVVSFLSLFLSVQVLNSIAIWCAAGVKTKAQMVRLAALAFFVFWVGGGLLSSLVFMVRGAMSSPDLFQFMLIQILSAVSLIAVFLSLGIAAFSPQTANRMMPFRCTITAVYIGSLLLWLLYALSPSLLSASVSGIEEAWVNSWLVALCVLMFIVASESGDWSARVKRTIPKNFLLRILSFPFYTGAVNGWAWLLLLFTGIIIVWGLGAFFFPNRMTMTNDNVFLFFCLLFCFDYSVTAMFIRERFSRWIKPQQTIVVVIVLGLVFIFGGMAAYMTCVPNGSINMTMFDGTYSHSFFAMFNPFLLLDRGLYFTSWEFTFQELGACAWAAVLMIPFVRWLYLRAVQFSPDKISGVMTLDEAVAAVAAAQKGKEKNKAPMNKTQ